MPEEISTLAKIISIGLSGGLGALSRFGLSGLVNRWNVEGVFPWGTVVVNVVGCLLFGIFAAIAENRLHLEPQIKIIVLIGFMGAFTTFSTYMFDTVRLLSESQWMLAIGNLALQNIIGIVCIVGGLALGRLF